jgi:hypothetical protein
LSKAQTAFTRTKQLRALLSAGAISEETAKTNEELDYSSARVLYKLYKEGLVEKKHRRAIYLKWTNYWLTKRGLEELGKEL